MNLIRKAPVTIFLVIANVLVFGFCYFRIHTFQEPAWTLNLLRMGAEFNPLTLDAEWYRIFTHMFLHGHIPHLLFNMYALFSVGVGLENEIGSKKFSWLYVLTGVGAALTSLYWNLFAIGVGASGAIFGLFGFSLVLNIFQSRREGLPIAPILMNFALFLGINLLFAEAMNADNSAHMGGLAVGVLLGAVSFFQNSSRDVKVEWLVVPLLVAAFFLLPRYQVTYFRFFQKVLDVEDSSRHLFDRDLSDEQYLEAFKREQKSWGEALQQLNAHQYLPEALHSDTFKLRRYIGWRMKQTDYRIAMVEKESYVYMDSIEMADNRMRPFLSLDYVLNMLRAPSEEEPRQQQPESVQEPIKQWYNEDWEEIPYPPGSFYRIGVRDSLGRWQGPVRDYYANGDVQMKGAYKNSQRDGVFIYYSDHNTYESAGRYVEDRHVGKWESYHANGRMESEVYYRDRYFLKNWWDSLGVQQVKDGEGRVTRKFANGIIAEEGDYRDGYQEGLWVGHHPSGELFYEEYYANGRLVRGRSRNRAGQIFIYDESSFFPVPEGGFQKYEAYLQKESERVMPDVDGSVRLSFRITPTGKMVELKVEKSLSLATDEKAKEIVRNGPRWQPAHEHGHVPVDGYQQVVVNFSRSI